MRFRYKMATLETCVWTRQENTKEQYLKPQHERSISPAMSSLSPPERLPPRTAATIAATAATGLLVAVFAMEHIGGLAPCELCLLQRWPHGAVILFGGVALLPAVSESGRRLLLALCALAFAITAGIGIYHVGVEQGIFAGPTACSGGITGDTVEELKRKLMAAPIVRCDEVAWSLFGISLAGYNVIASAGLTVFCAAAALRGRRAA
jgi:disulfide bond formation protein DsbB